MKDYKYNPFEEAKALGLTVKNLSFKKLNSFLIEKVIYLRQNMTRIEKRCTMTYEIVHYLWKKCENNKTAWHSSNVEEILKQQAARKLVCQNHLNELIAKQSSIDEITKELEVTTETLMYYYKYLKSIQVTDSQFKAIERVTCRT